MTPDPSAYVDDTFGPAPGEQSIPPHYQDAMDRISADLVSAQQSIDALWIQRIDAIETELRAAQSDVYTSVATVMGAIDGELRAAIVPSVKALDKAITTIAGDLIYAEEELRAVGVAVPQTPEARVIDLEEPTGDRLFARLTGTDPDSTRPPEALGAYHDYPIPSAPSVISDGAQVETPDGTLDTLPPALADAGATDTDTLESAASDCGCSVPIPCASPTITITCPPVADESEGGGGGESGGGGGPTGIESIDEVLASVPQDPIQAAAEYLFSDGAPGPVDEVGARIAAGAVVGAANVRAPQWYPLRWATSDVCGMLAETVAHYKMDSMSVDISAAERGNVITQIWRGGLAGIQTAADAVFSGLSSEVRSGAFKQYIQLTGDILGGASTVIHTLQGMVPGSLPDINAAWNIGMRLATAQKAGESTGYPMSYLSLPLTYALQFSNPLQIPSQSELNGAYLSGALDDQTWVCLTRTNGNQPDLARVMLSASQTRPNVSDIVQLYQRGVIGTIDMLRARMRTEGVLTDAYMTEYVALAQYIPASSDLVRYMTRDSADDDVVKQYGYDTDFEKKLYGKGGAAAPGPIAAWMRANGVTEDVMRYYWRSHWDIPSNTALYEMLHRLRPDRDEVTGWDRAFAANGEEAATKAFGPRPRVVTTDDVRRAIEVNDMAPTWVQPLVDISYHPINRTDVIDGYHAGAISERVFVGRMQDNGYTRENAEFLLDIQRAKRGTRLANKSGVWTERLILRAYMDGTINGGRADALLTPLVTDPGLRQALIQGADRMVDARVKSATLKRLRRAYIVGELEDVDATARLLAGGMSEQRAADLLSMWQDEQRGRYREPTAKMVIEWARNGLIAEQDAYQRLLRLGYISLDAERMIYRGLQQRQGDMQRALGIAEKRQAQVIKDKRAAKRADDKELEERAKEAQRELDRLSKELKRINDEQGKRKPAGAY